MRLNNDGQVTDLKGNVVRVDFRREPNPPTPRFPGANGLRPVKEGEREPECMDSRSGPAIPVLTRSFSAALAVA